MPTPKIDTGFTTSEYPARTEGFFGYPDGVATREPPYPYGQYPVPDPNEPCSSPIGCPVGFEITLTGGPTAYTASINDKSGHTVVWDWGDGTPPVTAPSDQSVSHTYATPGDYTVTATCHGTFDTETTSGGSAPSVGVLAITEHDGYLQVDWDNAALRAKGEHTFQATITMGASAKTTIWCIDVDDHMGYFVGERTPVAATPDGSLFIGQANPYMIDVAALRAAPPDTVYTIRFVPNAQWDYLVITGAQNAITQTPSNFVFVGLCATSVTQPANWRDGAWHPVTLTRATGTTLSPTGTSVPTVAITTANMDGTQKERIFLGTTSFMVMQYAFIEGETIQVRYVDATDKWETQPVQVLGALSDQSTNRCYLDPIFTGWDRAVGTSITCPLKAGVSRGTYSKPVWVGDQWQQRGALYKPGGTVAVTAAELQAAIGTTVTLSNVAGKFILS